MPASKCSSKASFKGRTLQTTSHTGSLQSTRSELNSLRRHVLPAQVPALLEIWPLAYPYPAHACTQEGLDRPKSVTTMPSLVNHPAKQELLFRSRQHHTLCSPVQSLHRTEDPVHTVTLALQSPPSKWKNGLHSAGDDMFESHSFTPPTDRTSSAVCQFAPTAKITTIPRGVPRALILPWPASPAGSAPFASES